MAWQLKASIVEEMQEQLELTPTLSRIIPTDHLELEWVEDNL